MSKPLVCGMIASDLDSTLLRNDKTISAYTVSVLRRCRERGVRVVLVTARSEKSSEQFTAQIPADGIISNGGALARCDGKIIYQRFIPRERAGELIARCLHTKGVRYITAETDQGYFANHPSDPDNPAWRDYSPMTRTDFSDGVPGGVYKITVDVPDNTLAGELGRDFSDLAMLSFAGEGWRCFSHTEARKEKALAAAADFFGVKPAAIASFGDDYGDMEMLRFCGHGTAVSNAIPEVKAAAVYICGSNDEDGPAKWLEAYAGEAMHIT